MRIQESKKEWSKLCVNGKIEAKTLTELQGIGGISDYAYTCFTGFGSIQGEVKTNPNFWELFSFASQVEERGI